MGTPEFVAKSDGSAGNLVTQDLWLASEVGGRQFCGTKPFTCGVCANLG